MYFIFVFGHLIKHNMKMDNKLKNINYLINLIILVSVLILLIQVSSVTDITTKITKYYVFKCNFAKKKTKFWKKIFRGVISDVILQLSPRYSFYRSKIDLP